MSTGWCAVSANASSDCPCLPLSQIVTLTAGIVDARIGGTTFAVFSASTGDQYSQGYGVGCGLHDHRLPPFCQTTWCRELDSECTRRFCDEPWCFVDLNACTGVPAPQLSRYFEPHALYYSYETCGGVNAFDAVHQSLVTPSPPPQPPPALPPGPPPVLLTASEIIGVIGGGVGTVILLSLLASLYLWERHRRATLSTRIAFHNHCRDTFEKLRPAAPDSRVSKGARGAAGTRDACGFYFVDADWLRLAAFNRERAYKGEGESDGEGEGEDSTDVALASPRISFCNPTDGEQAEAEAVGAASGASKARRELAGLHRVQTGRESQRVQSGRGQRVQTGSRSQRVQTGRERQRVQTGRESRGSKDGSGDSFKSKLVEPLPIFQKLLTIPGALRYIELSKLALLRGLYCGHILAVSHRWQTSTQPE